MRGITPYDIVIFVIVLACAGVLGKWVVPAEYRGFYNAVLAILFVVWVLILTGVLNKAFI